ncbi:hypothetical protein MBH78_19105 [Oceanimonas sp. NS1]|nr:hypothetical protein [Oceanimonas sp. NS1]
MSKLTQGTQIYFLDPDTDAVVKVDSVTAFNLAVPLPIRSRTTASKTPSESTRRACARPARLP